VVSVAAIEVCSYVVGVEVALLLKRETSIQHMTPGLEERPLCSIHEERLGNITEKPAANVQDAFQPIPGLISYAGVTGSVGITRHAHM